MSNIPFIDLKKPHALIASAIQTRIDNIFTHGQFINGPEVSELESALCDYTKAQHCIGCSSGTDALVLALRALGVKKDEVVLIPSFTFIATAGAVAQIGAIPYFVDIDDSYAISTEALKEAIVEAKKRYCVRGIIAVDLFGLCCDYDEISAIAKEESLFVIADAAQSFGASYKGKKVGTLADITTTSFFPAKPLGCYGDGGAVFTNNPGLAKQIESLREHGKGKDRYTPTSIGMNARLDTIQAAILLEKLKIFPDEFEKRQQVAKNYQQLLPQYTPLLFKDRVSAWAQYTIRLDNRDEVQQNLSLNKIPSMIYYKTPIHQTLPYQKFPKGDLSNTEKASKEVLSLPFGPYIDTGTQKKITYIINHFVQQLKPNAQNTKKQPNKGRPIFLRNQ